MKAGPDRRYRPEFRDVAVKQVIEGGRTVAVVARSLEMSNKSLANWVYGARKGQELVKRLPAQPVSELQTELSRLRQENAKLKLEKEILKNSRSVLCEGVDVKYAWIEKHRQTYSTTMMCDLLSVSRSGHKRRCFRVVTTDSKHAHPVAPDVLGRDFEATAPNQKWLADMTYVPTQEGWLHLALVLDLYVRKLVGWAMSETMPQELTLSALDIALGWRDPDAGLVHHSDHGSQHAAKDYRKKLKARSITVSMSRKGDCWDNAPMESVNGTLKVECVNDVHFETREEARQAIVEYIGYYNTERRHSSLANIAPAQFERRWRARTKPKEQGLALVRHRVTHRRPVPGSSQATEPAARG